jgi:hypothetical protein
MKPLRNYHPDLQACVLEERLLPVIANLSVIMLTTSGYALISSFPGASSYAGSSASGTAISSGFFMMGSGGISTMQPGNITGFTGLGPAGTAAVSGGKGGSITVGSGANDATAGAIPAVTRNTIANDALTPRPLIGRPSGDQSPVLPRGQFYRGNLPVTAPAAPASDTPDEPPAGSPSKDTVEPSRIRRGSAALPLASGSSASLAAAVPISASSVSSARES